MFSEVQKYFYSTILLFHSALVLTSSSVPPVSGQAVPAYLQTRSQVHYI